MAWIHITTPRGDHSFDLTLEEANDAYQAIVAISRQKDPGGYVQFRSSPTTIVVFPGEIIRQSVFQIGGIEKP